MLHKNQSNEESLGMDSILREEKDQCSENIGCIIVRAVFEPASTVKFLTSFLTSFLDVTKIKPIRSNPSKINKTIILYTIKDFHFYQHAKYRLRILIFSCDIAKTIHPYFDYFRNAWPHPSKMIVLIYRKL